MGFYSASQIVQDARRGRGARAPIEVRPVDVVHSHWDNTLEGGRRRAGPDDDGGQPALRLGLRQVAGMSQAVAGAIMAARAQRPFADVRDLCLRAGLDAKARDALAEAGALDALAGHRNAARWEVAGIEQRRPLLLGSTDEARIELPAPRLGEELAADYRSTGLSLRTHPMALLREQMVQRRILGSRELRGRPHGSGVHVAGLVTQRQRPATAKGTIFVTLEDEHGMVNVIVWPHLAIRQRKPLLQRAMDDFLDDFDRYLDEIRARFPGLPLFLYCFSMGSTIGAVYLIRRHPRVAGAVLASGGFLLPGTCSFLRRLR